MKNRYDNRHGRDPFGSIDEFVNKFGFKDHELTNEIIDYRMSLLKEEFQETEGAWREENSEEWVDGHIDIIVVALGNLAIAGVNARVAFNEVMRANMDKELGSRRDSDPLGMSIIKPEGWASPDHSSNHGELDKVWNKSQEIINEIDKILSED